LSQIQRSPKSFLTWFFFVAENDGVILKIMDYMERKERRQSEEKVSEIELIEQ
jgi:hypothetical protein